MSTEATFYKIKEKSDQAALVLNKIRNNVVRNLYQQTVIINLKENQEKNPGLNAQRKAMQKVDLEKSFSSLKKIEETKEQDFKQLLQNVTEVTNEYKRHKSQKKSLSTNYQNVNRALAYGGDGFGNTKILKEKKNQLVQIIVDLQPKIDSSAMHLYNSQIGQKHWMESDIIYQLKKLDQSEYFIFCPRQNWLENGPKIEETIIEIKDNKICISVQYLPSQLVVNLFFFIKPQLPAYSEELRSQNVQGNTEADPNKNSMDLQNNDPIQSPLQNPNLPITPKDLEPTTPDHNKGTPLSSKNLTTRKKRYSQFYFCQSDVSINHLFEDDDITFDEMRRNQHWEITLNREECIRNFKKILDNGRKGFVIGKPISKYDMYNSMGKALKQKIRQKAENIGHTHCFNQIVDVLKRYLTMCMKTKCKLCDKLAIFSAKDMSLEYPVINYGMNFTHPSCYDGSS